MNNYNRVNVAESTEMGIMLSQAAANLHTPASSAHSCLEDAVQWFDSVIAWRAYVAQDLQTRAETPPIVGLRRSILLHDHLRPQPTMQELHNARATLATQSGDIPATVDLLTKISHAYLVHANRVLYHQTTDDD